MQKETPVTENGNYIEQELNGVQSREESQPGTCLCVDMAIIQFPVPQNVITDTKFYSIHLLDTNSSTS